MTSNEIARKRKELESMSESWRRVFRKDLNWKFGENILTKIKDVDDAFYYGNCCGTESGFNLGVELAQKKFIKDMVFMLSKYFQSTSRQGFIQMKGNLSYQEFCKECYCYLQSLEQRDKKETSQSDKGK